MEIYFETQVLKDLLATCNKIVEKNAKMPILKNVALGFDVKGQLKFQATNLETSLNFGSFEPFNEHAVTVNYDIFQRAVKAQTGYCLTFITHEGCLLFNTGSAKIPYTPVSEWPDCNFQFTGVSQGKCEISAKDNFLKKLKTVIPSVYDDYDRMNMNGVRFDILNGRLVGTDGSRLTYTNFAEPNKVMTPFTLPLQGCKALEKSKFDFDSYTTLSVHSKDVPDYVFFSSSNNSVHISVRTIDLDYPDYTQIIPSSFSGKVTKISPKLLKAAIERAVPFCIKRDDRKIKMGVVKLRENKLGVGASNPESGEASTEIPCITETSKEYKWGLDLRFVKDFISTLDKNELIEIQYTDRKDSWNIYSFRGTISEHETLIAPYKLEE